ncbi:MAG: hypothetical protein ACXWPS_16725 [Ktedonobacteraceae bacterium]
MEETRCEGAFPGHASPMLMLRADCSLFTLIPASYSDQEMYSILHNDVDVGRGGTGHLDWYDLQ